MPGGRPAKPLYSPAESAVADIESGGGLMSYASASAYSTLSEDEIQLAVKNGEVEVFHIKRRTLIVKKSFVEWLAKHLAAERQRKLTESK